MAYKLRLPAKLSIIHHVFHVSMLRKYVPESLHILQDQPIEAQENLTYEDTPLCFLGRKEQVLRTKLIPMVKVIWNNYGVEEAS